MHIHTFRFKNKFWQKLINLLPQNCPRMYSNTVFYISLFSGMTPATCLLNGWNSICWWKNWMSNVVTVLFSAVTTLLRYICWAPPFSSPWQAMQNRLTSQNKNKISLLVCFCVAGSAKWADVTDSHAEPGGLWERWTYISDGCKHAGRDQTGTKEIFIQWVWVVDSPSYFILKVLHWSLLAKYLWPWKQNIAKKYFFFKALKPVLNWANVSLWT